MTTYYVRKTNIALMAIPFSRSLRSLHADGFRPALIGLFIAIALIGAWCAWFFFAEITLYQSARNAAIQHESITAKLPANKLERIRPGQAARLYLNGASFKKLGAIPAVVTDIIAAPAPDRQGQINLVALPEGPSPIFFQDRLTGRVEIEVEHISPFDWVMRHSGLSEDGADVWLSPERASLD